MNEDDAIVPEAPGAAAEVTESAKPEAAEQGSGTTVDTAEAPMSDVAAQAADTTEAGAAEQETDMADPAPAEVAGSEAGDPAIDQMAGEAVDPAQGVPDALQNAADLVLAGGPVVLILVAMSVIALGIVIAKIWQLAGAGLGDDRPVKQALGQLRQGRRDTALKTAEAGRGPAARALAAALACEPSGDGERAREAAWVAASEELEAARSWLRPLEVIASLAPLLGLFGTVLGMIDAFAALEAAGSQVDPSILSGGIWEALLTTAVGLAIAIPAVMAFNWFERRIERAEALAERSVAMLFSMELPAVAAPAPLAEPIGEGRFRAVAPG